MLARNRSRDVLLPAATILLPLLFFVIVRVLNVWNVPGWLLSWYYRGLFHYYAVYLVSFMALIAAIFDGEILAQENQARSLFIRLGFSGMAAFSLFGSLALPGVIMPGSTRAAFAWSSRLTLLTSGLFFSLAGLGIRQDIESKLTARRPLFWVAVLFAACFSIILVFSKSMDRLYAQSPGLFHLLAALSVLLLSWAAWRSWKRYRLQDIRKEKSLAVAMAMLAEAQIFQAIGSQDGLNWWLHQFLLVSALAITLRAMLIAFEQRRDFHPSRYFFALGSVIILGLSLLAGELGIHWFEIRASRLSAVSLAIVQGAIAFLALYLIVRHLDRLFNERITMLESEQDLRSELTQMIVHDLKNPLTVMKGSVDLLEQGFLGPLTKEQAGALHLVNRSSQKVTRLIDDMLSLQWLESGVLRIQATTLDPATFLKDAVDAIKPLLEHNQQNLSLLLPESLPHIHADPVLLNRVLQNLLANAMRFAPEGSTITLGATAGVNCLSLTVADCGPGIAPADRHRIFEARGSTKGMPRRGRGMSLAFCRLVCRVHGGDLTAEDNPDGGALFMITLPVSKLARAPECAPHR